MIKAKSSKIFYAFLILFSGIISDCSSQISDTADSDKVWGDWQISLSIGSQMSGIKKEDFVASNFSPLLHVAFGKWFSPAIALEIGYKGWYFNTISDEIKHLYGYYYGGATLNVKGLFRDYSDQDKWLLYLHAGSGYFYNDHYKRPNVCADLGISNNYRLSGKFLISLNLSAIMGWDIYQGDEDILPGLSVGMRYLF